MVKSATWLDPILVWSHYRLLKTVRYFEAYRAADPVTIFGENVIVKSE